MGSFKPFGGSGRQARITQVRTSRGEIIGFDQYRKRLMTLSMPDAMRLKEIRKMLMVDARPYVHKARQVAYAGSDAIEGPATKRRTKGGAWFYNLYSSIGAWANKGTFQAYVVIGLKNQKKRGAYYAGWQLTGLAPTQYSRGKRKGTPFPGYYGKDFLEEAAKDKIAILRSQMRLQRFINSRIAKYAA